MDVPRGLAHGFKSRDILHFTDGLFRLYDFKRGGSASLAVMQGLGLRAEPGKCVVAVCGSLVTVTVTASY